MLGSFVGIAAAVAGKADGLLVDFETDVRFAVFRIALDAEEVARTLEALGGVS